MTPDDPAAVAVRSASWIQVAAAPPIPDSLRPFRLDRGEEAVLALALVPSEEETEVLLDDLAARRCAAALGLKVRGSLTFLGVVGVRHFSWWIRCPPRMIFPGKSPGG